MVLCSIVSNSQQSKELTGRIRTSRGGRSGSDSILMMVLMESDGWTAAKLIRARYELDGLVATRYNLCTAVVRGWKF